MKKKLDYPWLLDYMRATERTGFQWKYFIIDFLFQHRIRYIFYLRKAQNEDSSFLRCFYEIELYRLCRRFGVEIKSQTEIGEGFVLIHPYNITVSPYAKLGNNVTMLKGSTIGVSKGKREGAPIIGDNVFIGINSTIVGGVEVGSDVLIAPNSFVNQDVPSHSVVIGNPCHIIAKDNATKEFI